VGTVDSLLWHLLQVNGFKEHEMISTDSILFTAIFVFTFMFIGLGLTALEFRRMQSGSKEEQESQERFTRRHKAQLVAQDEPRAAQEKPDGDNSNELHH
jgi:hypothetical protein